MDASLMPPEYHLCALTVPADRKGQAQFYGSAEKTIKTWAAIGRDAKDPAPFADPPAMVDWWERLRANGVLKHRMPQKLLDAAAKWQQHQSPAPAPQPVATPPAIDAAAPIDLTEFDADAQFDVAAQTAKLNYQVHAKLLMAALQSGEKSEIRSAQSAYEKAFETYRVAESSKTKIMAEAGLTVPREEVERKLIQLHQPMPRRLRASLLAAYRDIPDPRPPLEWWKEKIEAAIAEACHDLIRSLHEPEKKIA